MRLLKYTLEQLKNAVRTSPSRRQTLSKLNVVPAGGNYAVLNKAIKHFNIDISHFKGMGWNKGCTFAPKRDLKDYFTNKYQITSFRLKNRLIKEGIMEPICSVCGLEEWLEQPIPLELHHVDGSSLNNDYENLRLLCPNCHSLTTTYRKAKSAL